MKINTMSSIKKIDTSSGRGNDIVDGLHSVSYSLQKLENHANKAEEVKNRGDDSPYATDRPNYDASRIKGSETETSWKKVSLSREQQVKEISNDNNNEVIDNHQLGKKLNII